MPYIVKVVGWLECDPDSSWTIRKQLSELQERYERGELTVNPGCWSLGTGFHNLGGFVFFGAHIKYALIEEVKKQIAFLLDTDTRVDGFFYLQPIDGDLASSFRIERNRLREEPVDFLYDSFLSDEDE